MLREDHARAIELYRMSVLMRTVIEHGVSIDDITIHSLIESLLSTTRPALCAACGFEAADSWSIRIFEFQHDRDEYRCVAQEASVATATDVKRAWPSRTGIVGFVFSQQREVLLPDLSGASANRASAPFDVDPIESTHRSAAAVPVRVGAAAIPWGVVVAATDRVGYFRAKTAEPVRALAGMVGLAVAVLDRQAKYVEKQLPQSARAGVSLDSPLIADPKHLEEKTGSLESEISGIVGRFLAGLEIPEDMAQYGLLGRTRRRIMSMKDHD